MKITPCKMEGKARDHASDAVIMEYGTDTGWVSYIALMDMKDAIVGNVQERL